MRAMARDDSPEPDSAVWATSVVCFVVALSASPPALTRCKILLGYTGADRQRCAESRVRRIT